MISSPPTGPASHHPKSHWDLAFILLNFEWHKHLINCIICTTSLSWKSRKHLPVGSIPTLYNPVSKTSAATLLLWMTQNLIETTCQVLLRKASVKIYLYHFEKFYNQNWPLPCIWLLYKKILCLLRPCFFIKKIFSSSSLSAIRVVSFTYLRLLIFLPAVLIPACASSSPAFLMMHSA